MSMSSPATTGFLTARDGAKLFQYRWAPKGAARADVILVHGYGEHLGRYEETARRLTERGYRVRGCDLRGHGKSSGQRGHCRSLTEYLDDLDVVRAEVRSEAHGERPPFLLAHSFGGLLALRYCLERAQGIAGMVLGSPYLKLKMEVPAIKIAAGRAASRLWPSLAMPSGLKGSDASRDPEVVRVYDADPLNHKYATARWFTESSAAQAAVLARAREITLPCLLLHGSDDRIADPEGTRAVYERLGSTDKTLEILPGQLHELLNELPADRARTIAKILAWLDSRSGAKQGA
jgi:alpha-beta hydrolase superfamily lysophospholipase